ncbi:hypothetical protein CHS0354_025915, partial [Potamilus streckersoni]
MESFFEQCCPSLSNSEIKIHHESQASIKRHMKSLHDKTDLASEDIAADHVAKCINYGAGDGIKQKAYLRTGG